MEFHTNMQIPWQALIILKVMEETMSLAIADQKTTEKSAGVQGQQTRHCGNHNFVEILLKA